MNRLLFNLYDQLPTPLRSLAGTAYGHYVRRWRYGSGFDELVQFVLERDSWPASQWDTWHRQELDELLTQAVTRVPFYRRYWSQSRGCDWSELANWPILEKQQLRECPADLLVDACDRRRLFEDHTSGTTGTPLRIWSSRETLRRWYALFEARWRGWYGVSRHDRWAILGGRLIKPVRESAPPYWIWNGALHQLYMSSYHLSPNRIGYYLDALIKYRVRYVYGYTSALYELALGAIREKRQDLKMHVVIANAEPVFSYQRRAIEAAFGCPLRETYGMSEMCGGASQCEAGGLHLWPDAGVLEVVEGQDPVEPGQTGDLVFTGLVNRDMPLIRYRTGDRGAVIPDGKCDCGRTLPLLAAIEGRCDDMLYSARGDRIGRLDPVFKEHLPVKMAQLIQESLSKIHVRYVPAPGFGEQHAREITEQLRARLGDVAVTFEEVSAIPRTANGKFRAVICNLSEADRRTASSRTAE